ncbi:MAG: hypothetical protein MK207_01860 [Saprospiraceae bacterium]|nr:hypothetical protein [Saprospiraceae bacterium]
MKKYFFDLFIIATCFFFSFFLTYEHNTLENRKETYKVLMAIQRDLKMDTTAYNRILSRLEKVEQILLEALNGEIGIKDYDKFHDLLTALRAYHGVNIQKYGYNYLKEDTRSLVFLTGTLPHRIGFYHHSSTEGNFAEFNQDYYDICFENHKQLFSIFPKYLHPDSTISVQAINNGARVFLESDYWMGRVALTHRQVIAYNIPLNRLNKKLAIDLLNLIEKELY